MGKKMLIKVMFDNRGLDIDSLQSKKEEVFRPATSSLLSSSSSSSSSSKEFAEKSSEHCIGKWGKAETCSLEQKCGNSVKAFDMESRST